MSWSISTGTQSSPWKEKNGLLAPYVVCVCDDRIGDSPVYTVFGRGKLTIPQPFSHFRIRSRQLCTAIPSRINPLILHKWVRSGTYNYKAGQYFFILLSSTVSSWPVVRYRVSPEFMGHAHAYRCHSRPSVRQHRAGCSQGSSINEGCVWPHEPITSSLFTKTRYWYRGLVFDGRG